MTANAEARTLLDQLMGVERDALLPAGAALPRKRGRKGGGASGAGGMVLPGVKRTRSCYDRDIDPLYCAWGVDVYELFVNTKSDIGPNPNKPDAAARAEFLKLPSIEKRELGFEHRLFHKLQDLVQVCDRTVHRNHEKLKRELQRQSAKRGGNDYVVDVSTEKVEELVRAECQLEDMKGDLTKGLQDLDTVRAREEAVLAEEQKKQDAAKAEAEQNKNAAAKSKEESETEDGVKNEEDDDQDGGDATKDGCDDDKKDADAAVKTDDPPADAVKEEAGSGGGADAGIVIDREGTAPAEDEVAEDASPVPAPPTDPEVLEELGKLALRKQELLCKIATIVTQIGPVDESIHVMTLKLNFVRSDTTTDKTVCEISGNFMSARDADERIAAHYAGKQYVGWKLVRDKFRDMLQQHGRHGPPRPSGRGPGGPPLQSYQNRDRGGGGGGGGYDGRGGGGGGGDHRDRYRGGRDDRDRGRHGGGGRDRGSDGRWERGGGGDRDRYRGGGGGRDDRGRYGGGGGGDRDRYRGGGGGGYGRR